MKADALDETFGFHKRLGFMAEQLATERTRLGRELDVIDVGCGTAQAVLSPLAASFRKAVGLDVHLPSLLSGRAKSDARFVCGPIEAVRSASFDAVICSEVLEHVRRPEALLGELGRVLRPGGLCLVTTPNGFGPYEIATAAASIVMAPVRAFDHQNMCVQARQRQVLETLNMESGHVQFFTWARLQSLLSRAGFARIVYRGRTVACGPVLSQLVALHPFLLDLNQRAADILPPQAVSGWMFSLRRMPEPVNG